jgi:hypothetical protein
MQTLSALQHSGTILCFITKKYTLKNFASILQREKMKH